MTILNNKQNFKERRRELRKNATKAEQILWEHLRRKSFQLKFKRQNSVGPYIIDFYAPTIKLAVELDGEIHKQNKDYDLDRTNYLNDKGIKILRFWNSEVENNIDKVLEKIKQNM